MMSGVSDEMLMAFVDGELDDGSAEAVARAIETDPDIARRAAVFETSRRVVRSAFAGILSEPAPQRLVDAINAPTPAETLAMAGTEAEPAPGNVVPMRRRSFASAPSYAMALAASLVLAVGLGSGFWLGQQGHAVRGGLFQGNAALMAALASQPSGRETVIDIDWHSSRFSVLGSYSVEGGLCRAFRLTNIAEAVRGLACDRGQGFAVDVAVADGSAGATGFSPASDRAASSLDAYLDTLEAEGPLSDEEEAERLKARGNELGNNS